MEVVTQQPGAKGRLGRGVTKRSTEAPVRMNRRHSDTGDTASDADVSLGVEAVCCSA